MEVAAEVMESEDQLNSTSNQHQRTYNGIVSGPPFEASVSSVEVYVKYPGKDEMILRQFWMMHEPTSDMKSHLLQMENMEYTVNEKDVKMVIHCTGGADIEMEDDTTLIFYSKDLVGAEYVEIKKLN